MNLLITACRNEGICDGSSILINPGVHHRDAAITFGYQCSKVIFPFTRFKGISDQAFPQVV
jgi:hypothetical protein